MAGSRWRILYTRDGLKDKKRAVEAGFGDKVSSLVAILENDPYTPYPPYEKLIGDLKGAYSRKLNRQHRLVYSVHEDERIVVVLSLWTHYE